MLIRVSEFVPVLRGSVVGGPNLLRYWGEISLTNAVTAESAIFKWDCRSLLLE